LLFSAAANADESPLEDELPDRFVGEWVIQGMIAGGERTHGVGADWLPGHQYL
jgi:hypothetical protein